MQLLDQHVCYDLSLWLSWEQCQLLSLGEQPCWLSTWHQRQSLVLWPPGTPQTVQCYLLWYDMTKTHFVQKYKHKTLRNWINGSLSTHALMRMNAVIDVGILINLITFQIVIIRMTLRATVVGDASQKICNVTVTLTVKIIAMKQATVVRYLCTIRIYIPNINALAVLLRKINKHWQKYLDTMANRVHPHTMDV